ncbi:MAG: YaiI/YqxD family protein [Clostridiales bacterium]|jgi:uncharacterized protein YaiI (UPF0178 family)|nr:YaiI/YqxD family protein [Clostridiales bacterium]
MRILVDADACPVKQIIVRIARQQNIPVIMITDTSHELNCGYSRIITVDKEMDSVDFKLISMLTKDDIVITQDFGLAAMVIGKGARALNQNGLIFSDKNMDRLLFERHIGKEALRSGKRTKGPSKRSKEDDLTFEESFSRLISQE